MSENTDRSGYIDAIVKLLEKADLRKLRLIWAARQRPDPLTTSNPV